MFAPRPRESNGWFTIRGAMEDGEVVDLWTGQAGEPDLVKPRYVSEWYLDSR